MERFSSGLLLTSSQVADLLGVHVSTVKRWTNEGELRSSSTAGGHRRIHLDDALDAARERGIPTYLDPFAPFQGHVWRAVREAEDASDFRRVQSLAMGWLLREYPQRVGDLFVELGSRGRIPFDRFFDRGIREFLARAAEAVKEGRLRAGGERQVAQMLLEALFRIHLGVPLPSHPPPAPFGATRHRGLAER
jgi:excisionase family DNA binding protein